MHLLGAVELRMNQSCRVSHRNQITACLTGKGMPGVGLAVMEGPHKVRPR